jgi:hypothetical protein
MDVIKRVSYIYVLDPKDPLGWSIRWTSCNQDTAQSLSNRGLLGFWFVNLNTDSANSESPESRHNHDYARQAPKKCGWLSRLTATTKIQRYRLTRTSRARSYINVSVVARNGCLWQKRLFISKLVYSNNVQGAKKWELPLPNSPRIEVPVYGVGVIVAYRGYQPGRKSSIAAHVSLAENAAIYEVRDMIVLSNAVHAVVQSFRPSRVPSITRNASG